MSAGYKKPISKAFEKRDNSNTRKSNHSRGSRGFGRDSERRVSGMRNTVTGSRANKDVNSGQASIGRRVPYDAGAASGGQRKT